MLIVVENRLGTSRHQFIQNVILVLRFKMSFNSCFEQLFPTYDALIPRQLRLKTRSSKVAMGEISGTIMKTIALQSSPSKRSKAYGASSKVRLFPAQVGADRNTCPVGKSLCYPLF